MTSERSVQISVTRGLTSVGVRVLRVSNSVGAGTPDLAFVAHGKDGWLELKMGKMSRGKLVVRSQTKHQVEWMRAHAASSGRAFTLVRVEDEWLLFNASGSQIIDGLDGGDARLISRWRGSSPVRWDELAYALAS